MKWFFESNRWRHFVLGIPCGFLFTILFGYGIASGMEFKDCQSLNGDKPIVEWDWSNWDWIDWCCTSAGSLIGQILQIAVILLFV